MIDKELNESIQQFKLTMCDILDLNLRERAETAVLGTFDRYIYSHIEWLVAFLSKDDVQKMYSVTQADIDKAYANYKDYFGIYTEDEVKKAIRDVMVDWTETDVAPKIETGYSKHSLFKGITDEEHSRYSLRNILNGSGI